MKCVDDDLLMCRDSVDINILGVERMMRVCKALPHLEVKSNITSNSLFNMAATKAGLEHAVT